MSDILPLVSVVIPTYNYAQYIAGAVNSIFNQNYPTELIEIIIIDDGSTDNTREILQPFIDKGTIKYYFQENQGKAFATYKGIQRSTGKYIFNLDADDYFLPAKIARSVEIFESDEDIVHVASAAQCFFQDSQTSASEDLPASIIGKKLDGNWLLKYFYDNKILFGGGSTYAARGSVLRSIEIPVGVDMYIDEFLLLTILLLGKSFFNETPLSVWRIHTSNYSGKTVTKEKQIAKNERLLKSSIAILNYLKDNNFDSRLVKIYTLQHLTREIVFKEGLNNKSLTDIFQYGTNVFFKVKPGWKLIKKHHVLNRLIPTGLFNLLKRIK